MLTRIPHFHKTDFLRGIAHSFIKDSVGEEFVANVTEAKSFYHGRRNDTSANHRINFLRLFRVSHARSFVRHYFSFVDSYHMIFQVGPQHSRAE